VKVLDFGISKTNDGGPSGLTQTSAMMGSPHYMSPEQMMSSKDVDARADIWALGVILYELLAGAPPFAADTLPEIVFMVTQRDSPPLAGKRPDVPTGLAEVVGRCLLRDPAQRYANVAKLASALAPFGPPRSEISIERISRVLGASAPPPPEASAKATAPMQATSSTWASSQAGIRARSKTRLAIIVGASLTVAVGMVFAWRALRAPSGAPRGERPPTAAVAHPAGPAFEAPPAPTAVLIPVVEAPVEAPQTTTSKPLVAAPVGARPAPVKPKPVQLPPAAQPPPAFQPAPNRGLNMGMKE
jgi:serine/threonine-protein kinase